MFWWVCHRIAVGPPNLNNLLTRHTSEIRFVQTFNHGHSNPRRNVGNLRGLRTRTRTTARLRPWQPTATKTYKPATRCKALRALWKESRNRKWAVLRVQMADKNRAK